MVEQIWICLGQNILSSTSTDNQYHASLLGIQLHNLLFLLTYETIMTRVVKFILYNPKISSSRKWDNSTRRLYLLRTLSQITRNSHLRKILCLIHTFGNMKMALGLIYRSSPALPLASRPSRRHSWTAIWSQRI